jgi:HPt (histidine-containing phosphotransfer) domain-containing protein
MQVIDIDLFVANLGGDVAVAKKLLRLFVETADSSFAALEQGLRERSLHGEDWSQHMHLLKGAALNVTARRFAHLAAEGQQLEAESAQAREEFFLVLRSHYQQVRHHIALYLSAT